MHRRVFRNPRERELRLQRREVVDPVLLIVRARRQSIVRVQDEDDLPLAGDVSLEQEMRRVGDPDPARVRLRQRLEQRLDGPALRLVHEPVRLVRARLPYAEAGPRLQFVHRHPAKRKVDEIGVGRQRRAELDGRRLVDDDLAASRREVGERLRRLRRQRVRLTEDEEHLVVAWSRPFRHDPLVDDVSGIAGPRQGHVSGEDVVAVVAADAVSVRRHQAVLDPRLFEQIRDHQLELRPRLALRLRLRDRFLPADHLTEAPQHRDVPVAGAEFGGAGCRASPPVR